MFCQAHCQNCPQLTVLSTQNLSLAEEKPLQIGFLYVHKQPLSILGEQETVKQFALVQFYSKVLKLCCLAQLLFFLSYDSTPEILVRLGQKTHVDFLGE